LARHGLYDLDLFAVRFYEVADVDDTLETGAGTLYSAVQKSWPLLHDEPSALSSLVANG
jgi:hypothetical protein